MFNELPLPAKGTRPPDRHHLLTIKPGPAVSLTILSVRPVRLMVHWSEVLHRSSPCLHVQCPFCGGSQPLPKHPTSYFAAQRSASPRLVVVEITEEALHDLLNSPQLGASWRGAQIVLKRAGDSPKSRLNASVLTVVESSLHPEWDVRVDLARVWGQQIPRAAENPLATLDSMLGTEGGGQ